VKINRLHKISQLELFEDGTWWRCEFLNGAVGNHEKSRREQRTAPTHLLSSLSPSSGEIELFENFLFDNREMNPQGRGSQLEPGISPAATQPGKDTHEHG
jgi:hypothetical protein